jgi:hypothetical protein
MRKVGEEATEILDYVPFQVIRHVRPAFSCRQCESMAQAPMLALPVERGRPGPGLLAHVLVGKYCDHLPLYRQSGIYAGEGVELDRAALADWVGNAAWLLSPLAGLGLARAGGQNRDRRVVGMQLLGRHDMAGHGLDQGSGSICATSGPMAGRFRRRSSIATRLIAKASIRASIRVPRLPPSRRLCRLRAAL